jgi:hypothetical protein
MEDYVKIEELDKNDNIFEYIDSIYESKVGDTDEQVKDDN